MADWGLQLITTVVKDPESPKLFEEAKTKGIRTEMFGNAEARAVWGGIEYHYNRPEIFGHIPSEMLLKERYTSLELPVAQENFEDLCLLIKNRYTRKKAEEAIEEFSLSSTASTDGALSSLYAELSEIQEHYVSTSDRNFTELALRETLNELTALNENSGIVGMPFPWEKLNAATGGIQPGDFILTYALPKSMKTWVGLYIAVHLATTGRKVLVYSKEMMWETMRRRIACIVGKVDYGKYRKNTLSDLEKHQLLESLSWFEETCEGDIEFTTADRADGTPGGPAEVRRKLELYRPQFILLDSAYMLELPNGSANAYDWKAMSLVNRQLKQIAKTTGVPIMAIYQENERAAYKYKGTRGTASLAMNTSVVMDCDLTIRIVYNKKRQELSLHLPASRETLDDGFTIHANAAENFAYAHDKLWEVGEDSDEPETTQTNTHIQTAITSLSSGFLDSSSPMIDNFQNGDIPED